MNLTALNKEQLLEDIAARFDIDTNRYTPVKIESQPFVALYCIDQVESKVEGREWIAKFDILPADPEELKNSFSTSSLDFAISTKYATIIQDEGNTIDFPDLAD